MKLTPQNIAKLLVLSIIGIPVFKTAANGLALPDQDAFATARGEAVVATADNPSAIYYNPAGITQLEGVNVRAGIYLLDYNTTFKPPQGAFNAGQSYDEQDNFAAIPRIFCTLSPTNLPLSFGLGVYSPFGGKMSWPQDTGFRSVALSSKLTYVTINPVVAWKILPSLSVAAGPMINYANMDLEQGMIGSPSPPNFFYFTGNGWSVGYNLGVRWQPIEQLSFGGTFRSPAEVTLDGKASSELRPPTVLSSPAKADFTFPLSAVMGVSWRPTPKWNLEFDAGYTDWSSFSSTTIHQSQTTRYIPHKNLPVILDWQPSWTYEFGVTRYFDNGWHVSAGYCFNENSIPDSHYTPLVADMDRHFFSLGTGYQGKHLSLDVAYQFGYGPEHTVTDSHPSSVPGIIAYQNANGKYNFYSNAISLAVGWHF